MTAAKKAASRCSFCNRSANDVGFLADGMDLVSEVKSHICRNCAEKSVEIIARKEQDRRGTKTKQIRIPSPRLFYDHLDSFVIGQDRAKKNLAVAVTNHFKRLVLGAGGHIPSDDTLRGTTVEKSNVLLIGPTGSGKTLLAKSLADYLNVPFAIGDATTLTEAGYVGEDVENLLLKLLHAADFDLEAAQRGIIYIDEVDKLHKTGHNVSITRDVSGEGVQQSLLKMIEGYTCNVPPQGGRKHPEQQYIQLDTSNILFICGGSFVGLSNIVAQRLGKKRIGFGQGEEGDTVGEIEQRNRMLSKVEQRDLETFGIIPELVGRLPIITTLDELSIPDLVRVLKEPRNALLNQYRLLADIDGIKLDFTDEAATLIATKAHERGTGARALRSVVEEFMIDLMFNMSKGKKDTLVVTPEVVLGLDRNVKSKVEAA